MSKEGRRPEYVSCDADGKAVLLARGNGIAACLLDGMADKEIARAMNVPLPSVRSGVRLLRQRLGARSTRHLIALLAHAAA